MDWQRREAREYQPQGLENKKANGRLLGSSSRDLGSRTDNKIERQG